MVKHNGDEELQNTICRLKKEASILETGCLELEINIKSCKAKRRYSSVGRIQQELQPNQKKLVAIRNELENKKAELLDVLEQPMEKLKARIDWLKNDVDLLKIDLSTLETNMNSFIPKNDFISAGQFQSEVELKKEKLHCTLQELEDTKSKLTEVLREKITDLKDEVNLHNKYITTLIINLSSLIAKKDYSITGKFQEELQTKKEKVNRLQQELESFKRELEKLLKEPAQILEEKISWMQENLANIEEHYTELTISLENVVDQKDFIKSGEIQKVLNEKQLAICRIKKNMDNMKIKLEKVLKKTYEDSHPNNAQKDSRRTIKKRKRKASKKKTSKTEDGYNSLKQGTHHDDSDKMLLRKALSTHSRSKPSTFRSSNDSMTLTSSTKHRHSSFFASPSVPAKKSISTLYRRRSSISALSRKSKASKSLSKPRKVQNRVSKILSDWAPPTVIDVTLDYMAKKSGLLEPTKEAENTKIRSISPASRPSSISSAKTTPKQKKKDYIGDD